MKKYLFFAAAITVMASCTSDTLVNGDSEYLVNGGDANQIVFSTSSAGQTRGDIYGSAAATLLGNNFYVTGTKGTEANDSPSPILVFDNYLVHFGVNTAGTTESNTANWEYVGVTPGTSPYANYAKLSALEIQTIKYWDYSQPQYDFLAFSTGTQKAVTGKTTSTIATDEINVTAMKYGANLASNGIAYTFIVPTVNALKQAYISDITEVPQSNYGKEVNLKFKNLGSKVRVALYETVPGYSVKNVEFYTVDNDAVKSDQTGYNAPTKTAALISAADGGIPNKGTIEVYFPHVGNTNASIADYDRASATVTPITIPASTDPGYAAALACYDKAPAFGTLAATKLAAKERYEIGDDNVFLGRSLPAATYAGDKDEAFYTTVFPVSSSSPLTLRVNYTLVPIDGAKETINVYGAKAIVPSTYTKWLPNYAYTYIFKISDNTNGWTNQDKTQPGLFPITFDAVVAEATDATGEQRTITTVATPSITTYQQNHDITKDEYSKATAKNIYVQVMDNNLSPSAVLVGTEDSKLPLLNAAQESASPKYHASLLYKVDDNATEAMVMDALENRDATIADYNTDVKGRNGITLTYNSNISNSVTSIVNGVDNNAITVTAGQAAEIAIASLTEGTYAYVYDYSWKSETSDAWSTSTAYSNKSEVVVYEAVTPASSSAIGSKTKYYSISTTALNGVTPSTDAVTVDNAHLYFSKTTNGTGTTTYSYISVANKIGTTLPKGVVVVAKSDSNITEVNGSDAPVDGNFYFDKFFSNNGKYAVKVIKVVN